MSARTIYVRLLTSLSAGAGAQVDARLAAIADADSENGSKLPGAAQIFQKLPGAEDFAGLARAAWLLGRTIRRLAVEKEPAVVSLEMVVLALRLYLLVNVETPWCPPALKTFEAWLEVDEAATA